MFNHHLSNKSILRKLDGMVYGHEIAKKTLINAVNRARLRSHQIYNLGINEKDAVSPLNTFLIGQSGTGKTKLVESLVDIVGGVWLRYDATDLSPVGAGSGGTKVHNIIRDAENAAMHLAETTGKNPDETLTETVVFIDEFDKLGMVCDSSGNWNKFLQASLLRLLEGNTEAGKMTFVLAGAFSDSKYMKKEKKNTLGFCEQKQLDRNIDSDVLLSDSGIMTEIIGRIDNVVMLDDLTIDSYYKILSEMILPRHRAILRNYYVYGAIMKKSEMMELATRAAESGLGVRYLIKEVNRIFFESEFSYEEETDNMLLEYKS